MAPAPGDSPTPGLYGSFWHSFQESANTGATVQAQVATDLLSSRLAPRSERRGASPRPLEPAKFKSIPTERASIGLTLT